MPKSIRLIFISLICLSFTHFGFTAHISFELSFDAENVLVKAHEGFHIIQYPDNNTFSFSKPGYPDIPGYIVRVLVPENNEVTSVTIKEHNRTLIGNFIPYPFQGYHVLSKPFSGFVSPYEGIYKSGSVYPEDRVLQYSTETIRGFNVLYLSLCPFEYDTASNNLYLIEDLTVNIGYKASVGQKGPLYAHNEVFERLIASSVINPQSIREFYPSKYSLNAKSGHDLLIITTDYLKTSAEAYADFRAGHGISSIVKTVSEIQDEYYGETIQLKIKQCIHDLVINENITFVFLIGDAGNDPNYSVPDQKLYGYVPYGGGVAQDNTIPGDVFYSSFGGQFDWNLNGNDRVGEMNVDGADISPDIIIGRLPVRTPQHVYDYLAKVEEYIGSASHPEFPENLLLSGVILWTPGDAEIKSEIMYSNYIEPYWDYHNKHTLYDSVTTVSVNTLSDKLEENMNLFHMATHGMVDSWSMGTGRAFNSNDALLLDNIPGTLITIACLSNAFDPEVPYGAVDPCLSEAFIRNPDGGSIIFIGASRYGWGYPNPVESLGPSFQYNNWIFKHLLEDHYQHNIGEAFTLSKIQMTSLADSENVFRWVHFALNLIGDPTINVHTQVHANVMPPVNFTAQGVSTDRIDLSWQKNYDQDNVMLVYSYDNVFGFPEDGVSYGPGATLPGGGTVLYRGGDISFSHTGLDTATRYFYSAFSYSPINEYSHGRRASASTLCDVFYLPFSEDFDSSLQLPLCWEIIDNIGNDQVWKIGNINNGLTGTTGNYAYIDSDGYGYTGSQDTDLVTPELDLSFYENVSLSFTHYFRQFLWSSTATLSYSIDNGESWNTIESWSSTTSNPAYFSQVIPEVAGQSSVRFKWGYTGSWSYYWCIDDVFIDGDGEEVYLLSLSPYPHDLDVELIGEGFYPAGSIVHIHALTDTYTFLEWAGEQYDIDLLDNHVSSSTFFTMPERDIAFTAVYDETPEYTLQEALGNPDLTWTTSTQPDGISTWFAQDSFVFHGQCSAQSGEITHNQSTSIHTEVLGPGELSFYWAVSSELNYDWLSFYVNDTLMDRISGIEDWHQMSYELPAGQHTLTWAYEKDGSISSNEDAGWLDLVEYEIFPLNGPDASIQPDNITYYPEDPLPGDTVQISARVFNIGDQAITSGKAKFYFTLYGDMELIDEVEFGEIQPSDFLDIVVDWETYSGMQQTTYILTVELTDILPFDADLSNNIASTDIGLPVELAFFRAQGVSDKVVLSWMTLSEVDNLGFNIYRLPVIKENAFMSILPGRVNSSMIPGQGTSSNPHIYGFTDSVEHGAKYIYILEAVSVHGATEEYSTEVKWIF